MTPVCPIREGLGVNMTSYLDSSHMVSQYLLIHSQALEARIGGHGGRVVTLSPPTSEAGVRSPSRPYVGKLVVACRWSAVYSTQP